MYANAMVTVTLGEGGLGSRLTGYITIGDDSTSPDSNAKCADVVDFGY